MKILKCMFVKTSKDRARQQIKPPFPISCDTVNIFYPPTTYPLKPSQPNKQIAFEN